jgi:cyclic lactone autoinducer peptide
MKSMKNKFMKLAMFLVGNAAMLTAVLEVNRACPHFFHQEQEPESVRKLRKF